MTDDTANKEEGEEDVLEAVKERLSFFFSNANLRQDGFLRKQLLAQEGKITVETLLRFNTIKQHTTDPAVIVQAAKALPDILVVSDNAVGRVEPFRLEQMDDNIGLSLLVQNLPLKEEENDDDNQDNDEKKKKKKIYYACTGEEIRALFQEHGKVALVKLRFQKRRDLDDQDDNDLVPSKEANRKGGFKPRIPRGSAMVEFETKQELQKAADHVLTNKDGETVEPKRKLELGGQQLQVVLVKEYLESRKKRKLDQEKEKKNQASDNEQDKEEVQVKTFVCDWKPGCVIRLEGLAAECDREAILDAVATGLDITLAQVNEKKIRADYSRGQEDGAIRFNEPCDDVKSLCEKLSSGQVEIKGVKVKVAKVLEGEEESDYWNGFIEFKNKQLRQRAEERASSRNQKRQRRS